MTTMGLFDSISKIKTGLAKTRDTFVAKVQHLAATKSKIDDDVLDQLEEILIASDVGVETAGIILAGLRRRVKEEKYESSTQLLELLKKEISDLLHVETRYRAITLSIAN